MDNTILQILIVLILTFAIPGITWFLVKKVTFQLTADIKEIKEKQSHLREKLPIEYVRRSDYMSDIRDIKVLLEKIFDKLDTKADKG